MVDQDGGWGGGGSGTPLKSPTRSLMNMKPPSQHSSLAECFKLNCGDKNRPNVPKRLTAPPSESFFKYGVRALWADKHSPKSLSAFQCHTQQAQQLKQLIRLLESDFSSHKIEITRRDNLPCRIKFLEIFLSESLILVPTFYDFLPLQADQDYNKLVYQGDSELLTMKKSRFPLQMVISKLHCGILIANVNERCWQSRDTVLGIDFTNLPKKAAELISRLSRRMRRMKWFLNTLTVAPAVSTISYGNCPHLLLQGPSGAGKKALAIALLHDMFGDVKVLPEHRPFPVQGGPYPTITVPIATSKHHVEVNLLHIGEYDKDVLPTIFKEIHISSERARLSPLQSQAESEFKLILVQNGEKLTEEAQQALRKLMDRYGDTCKLVLCCNMNEETFKPVLREGIRSRTQIINVEVPSREEIVKVLTTVAKKEGISLPKVFATRIAEHCKDSLRKAIVQLEACKNYQYPFSLDQPVHISHWEEDLVRIVADIVADPTPRRLFAVRVKMQALLTDCVSAILILQKLLEEFLLLTDVQLKKQICHWAGFYEIRLRTVPNPIIQLEAFLAKVMSMYKAQSILTARLSFTASRYSSDSSDYHEMGKSPLARPLVTSSPYLNMRRAD